MARPKLAPKRKVGLILPEELLAEMYLLKPELQTPQGVVRHGALSGFFTQLLVEHLEDLKHKIKAQHRGATQ